VENHEDEEPDDPRVPALVHISGSFMPDTGQACVICGFQLFEGMGKEVWYEGKDIAAGWPAASLILVDGVLKLDLSNSIKSEEDYPDARRCNSDDSDEVMQWR